jgi:hypothetical protein
MFQRSSGNTLNSSLYKSDAFKSSWATILTSGLVLTGAQANPRILPATIYGDVTSMLTQADQALLAERGPGGPRELLNNITAPTLLIQGNVRLALHPAGGRRECKGLDCQRCSDKGAVVLRRTWRLRERFV